MTREINYVSSNQLSIVDECVRKWWALYSKDITPPKRVESTAINLGNSVHKILEMSLKAKIRGVNKCVNPHIITPNILKNYDVLEEDKELIPGLINNAIGMGWYDNYDCGNVETEFKIKHYILRNPNDPNSLKIKIGGKIDRLEFNYDTNTVYIDDIKTGKRPYQLSTLKSIWQAKIYSLPYLTEFERIKVGFWFIRYHDKKLSVEFNRREIPMIERSIIKRVKIMEETDGMEYTKNKFCNNCPALSICKKMGR